MDLVFDNRIVEFSAETHFNLHLEGAGVVSLFRRTSGTDWDFVTDIKGNVIDVDVVVVLPKEYRLECENEPTMAVVTFASIVPDNKVEYEDYTEIGGELIRINDAKKDSISVLKVNGNAVQYSTPTPSAPVDITTNKGALKHKVLGNNLMNVNEGNIITGKYIDNSGAEKSSAANFYIAQFIKVKASTVYTASFGKQIGYFSFMEYDETFTFIKRTLYGESGKKMTSCSHTMGDTTAFVVVGSNPTSAEVTKDEVLETQWMLNEGSSALPYEVYSAGLVDEGEDTISSRSVNLNEGTLSSVGYTSTGGTSNSTTFCGTLCKIRVAEGQKYTVSFGGFPDGVSGVFVNTWKTDGSWNTRQAISSSGKLTYTIPSGVGFANFTLYKTGGITIGADSWMQVELGTDATDYEPYAFYGQVDIERLLKCGDYVDSQDIINGIIKRNVGIKVFDGTETLSLSSGTYNYGVADKLKKASPLLCTHYPYTAASASTAADKTIKSYASQNIGFKDSSFATVADCKEFLAREYAKGTPVIVVYPLATEVAESVDAQSLPNPEGDFSLFRQPCFAGLGMEVALKVAKPSGPSLITFTVEGYDQTFTAEEGMTWFEFCASTYNTEGWDCPYESTEILLREEGDGGWFGIYYYLADPSGMYAYGSDTIINEGNYGVIEDNGIGGMG